MVRSAFGKTPPVPSVTGGAAVNGAYSSVPVLTVSGRVEGGVSAWSETVPVTHRLDEPPAKVTPLP